MALPNPAGREHLIMVISAATYCTGMGAFGVAAGFVLLQGPLAGPVAVAAVVALLICSGLLFGGGVRRILQARREARAMPYAIEVGADDLTAFYRIARGDGSGVARRRVPYGQVDHAEPLHQGFKVRWNPPALYGHFDQPLRSAGEPSGADAEAPLPRDGVHANVVFLSRENYEPVVQAWMAWRRSHPSSAPRSRPVGLRSRAGEGA